MPLAKKLPALGAALKPQPRQMVSFADGNTISIVQPIPYAFVRYAREGELCWESRNGHTEFIFQIADLPVKRRLGNIEAHRRLRDVQLLGNGNEVTKMAPFRLDSCQHGGKFFWPVDADVPPRSDAFMHNSASVRWSRGKYPRQRAKENNVQSVA